MNDRKPLKERSAVDIGTLLVRWLLGAFFIYTGLVKALDPVEFLKLVHEYDLTHTPWLLNSIASALPWFEVFCGLLLLFGIAVRGSALTLVLMLVPFSFVVLQRAVAIQAAQGIPFCAVKFDCGCGTGEVFICRKLLENFVLLLASVWLIFGRGRIFCARYSLV